MSGESGGDVPDLTPEDEAAGMVPPACEGCSLEALMERRWREARSAAWAGVLAAILGTLSWTTFGFAAGAVAALAFALYAARVDRRLAAAPVIASAIATAALGLRLAGAI